MQTDRVILTGHCEDREGIVATITQWIAKHSGNILHLDQHVDPKTNRFFIRINWDLSASSIPKEDIEAKFRADVANSLKLDWSLHYTDRKPRMAIFVSQLGHCLWDLLARYESGEWNVEIPLIVSNHEKFQYVAKQFGIPFHLFPITKENKAEQEAKKLAILKEQKIDFIVLARYMQILSNDLVSQYPNQIINIHHSFLPAFAGAKPYHRAHERGVKLIGATAHYVTAELDEGPIIEQDCSRVSHRDSVEDMIRKGCDLEKIVLANAIYLHLNRQLIVHGNRTVVFTWK